MPFLIFQRKEGIQFFDYLFVNLAPTENLDYGLITTAVSTQFEYGDL